MIYLFWDKMNDEFLFLGEDGNFWAYGEDEVAREQELPNWQYWMRLHPAQDITPLNTWDRYDFFAVEYNSWIPWADVFHNKSLLKKIHRLAKDPHWMYADQRA